MRDPRRLLLLILLGALLSVPLLVVMVLTVVTGYRVGDGQRTLLTLLPIVGGILLLVLTFVLLSRSRGGGRMGMGSMPRREVSRPTVRFSDVAGVEEAKEELAEIVEYLRDPERLRSLGATIPKGVLLAGPPGTGKTLLSKAVAGEAGVAFIAISGSEFVEMIVGVGASRVRGVFAQARKQAPCLIFIDEIDAVGRRRGSGMNSNDEREQTLNQLLVEMDGFDDRANIIVIAATNRIDVLDPALLRPGRFDRQVSVDVPDVAGRVKILEVHARNKKLSPTVDLRTLARQTPGFSGADLANVLNEAALLGARRNAGAIGMDHLEEAIARVMGGAASRSRILTERDRSVIAHHETGHAIVFHVLAHCDPVHKITIVSRGRSLGWTMALPEQERVLLSRAQLRDKLAAMLGGRCAEELVFGAEHITTGAHDDLQRATEMARRMVTEWGMSPLGLRTFSGTGADSLGRDHSERMAWAVDEEVERLIAEAEQRARQTLVEYRDALEAVARRLLEVETMEASEMAALVIANPPSIGGSDPSAPVQMPQASTASRPVARRRTPRLRRPA
ncbi:MAG: ATP-dependent metallopeptidase FtsH/Yme1/Tma family protein [Chloroflexi bacterium]|jgi:cell division protease FtsH|nr:ATP-dependent metallopeptidase FtsH/Yme1/Tma family protein [Chloroflexota bacterium]